MKKTTKKLGRPVDPAKAARVRYTIKLNPALIKSLKYEALEKDVSVSDILENLLKRELAA